MNADDLFVHIDKLTGGVGDGSSIDSICKKHNVYRIHIINQLRL